MSFLFDEFLLECQKLRENNISFVIGTLIDKKNSVPQEVGAKIIITLDGLKYGTVGGGALENKTIQIAQELLDSTKKTLYKEFHLNKDLKMTCGGFATLLFEKVETQKCWNIVIFGAGHVAQSVIRTLLTLDCKIQCIDNRLDWLEKLPKSSKLEIIKVDQYIDMIDTLEDDSYILIMTPGHKFDLPILKDVLTLDRFPYVGVIGAKTKRKRLDMDLLEHNIKKDFFCPMGEKIGSNNPSEIAISITAQLLKIRDEQKKR